MNGSLSHKTPLGRLSGRSRFHCLSCSPFIASLFASQPHYQELDVAIEPTNLRQVNYFHKQTETNTTCGVPRTPESDRPLPIMSEVAICDGWTVNSTLERRNNYFRRCYEMLFQNERTNQCCSSLWTTPGNNNYYSLFSLFGCFIFHSEIYVKALFQWLKRAFMWS